MGHHLRNRTIDEAAPGIEPSFSQPIRDNILESISQIDGQIIIKVFSQEMEGLQEKAQEVLRTVAGVRGVARAFIDRAGQIPQLRIEIDRARDGSIVTAPFLNGELTGRSGAKEHEAEEEIKDVPLFL